MTTDHHNPTTTACAPCSRTSPNPTQPKPQQPRRGTRQPRRATNRVGPPGLPPRQKSRQRALQRAATTPRPTPADEENRAREGRSTPWHALELTWISSAERTADGGKTAHPAAEPSSPELSGATGMRA